MIKCDVAIIGAGPAGIFTAMRLKEKNPSSEIMVIDQGRPIEKRWCPAEITGQCKKCSVCSITSGFSGAGAFSDCKLSLFNLEDTTLVGGELEEFRSLDEIKTKIEEVLARYLYYGAPDKKIGGTQHPVVKKMAKKAEKAGLELVSVPFIHTGSTKARQLFYKIQKDLIEKGVKMIFQAKVTEISIGENFICEYTKGKGVHKISARKVVIATGRAGAAWNYELCGKLGIPVQQGRIKIGVRFELPNNVMWMANELYEAKLKRWPTNPGLDPALTFCHNPGGKVVMESYEGRISLANGQSDIEKTDQTNLALLFKMDLGSNAIQVAESMAETVNSLGDGQVIVQRWEDFLKSKPTTKEQLKKNKVVPTLKEAQPGNLKLGICSRLSQNIESFVKEIDKVIPGFAGNDNLLYGLEIKFSNLKILLNRNFMTPIDGLFFIGDGAGVSNGLIQSSTGGWILGEYLAKN